MDRNSIIGFILLILLGAGYVFWTNHEQSIYLAQKAADSTAAVLNSKNVISSSDSLSISNSSNLAESQNVDSSTVANTAFHGQTTYTILSNKKLRLRFSSKGGTPIEATIKEFKTYSGDSLNYFDGNVNQFDFDIPFDGRVVSTSSLYFSPSVSNLADTAQKLTMSADLGEGKKVIFYYVLPNEDYMMTAGFRLIGFKNELAGAKSIPLTWTTQALMTEKDMESERYYMQVHYNYSDGDNNYERVKGSKEASFKKPLKWFSVRSHFFNSTIIADNNFGEGNFEAKDNDKDDSLAITVNTCHLNIPVTTNGNEFNMSFRWLISPNDYHLLKSYDLGLDNIISLGYGPFFFVKYISMWVIIPLFTFLLNHVASVGLCIILLIFIIRLFLSFFTYKSHLSSAKMRALKPEIEELKEKFGKDKQQMSMEQMKLYRTAGASPLGGCLPMVLQMPFLLAVYYFIPTSIALRQIPFLWSKDLSTYDSIFNLGFHIPFYGDHVSLFTLLMTVTSLFLAVYNKNNMTGATPGGGGESGEMMTKMMKYMPYFMPIMFLGWFNGMAAGLTLYYTCSNLISLGQQFVIQKFIIDEDSIRAKIVERRKRPANGSTSKWQQRLEEMQKAQSEKMKKGKK